MRQVWGFNALEGGCIVFKVLSKTLPNVLLNSLNYFSFFTKPFTITFDFLPSS